MGGVGVLCAWMLRRYSTLSARNLYPPAAIGVAGLGSAVAAHAWTVAMVVAPVSALAISAAVYGRRLRLADLGAGEELRSHEQARRWVWQPRPPRLPGERVYLRSQGELVRRRAWPPAVSYVPMGGIDHDGLRLPLGDGQHIFACGATGSGKTTTMRRVLAARTITQNAALLILDQKGDQEDVEQMRRLAGAAGVPFVLIDPQDPCSDRYQPLWGTPAQVTARAVEPIKQSEPYYYDVLRLHLDVVCRVLHAADRWPPSIPFLIDACHPHHFGAVAGIAKRLGETHGQLVRRVKDHAKYVESSKGNEDLSGGAARLQVALALASREIVTPRITPEGDAVGVGLVDALKARAVVMWRMHADVMPDEAAAMTVLALADLHDAAAQAGVQWTLMLDEFGAVIKMASSRAVAILQRGRSHGGQVIVVTQSVADPEALSGQPGLLPSLTDNFSGVVAHRQTAPNPVTGSRSSWERKRCGNQQTRRVATAPSTQGAGQRDAFGSSASDRTHSLSSGAGRQSSTQLWGPTRGGRRSSPSSSTSTSPSGSARDYATPARYWCIPNRACRRLARVAATRTVRWAPIP